MLNIAQDYQLPAQELVPNSYTTWDYGVSLEWVRSLRQSWLNDFDWRDVEQELNTSVAATSVGATSAHTLRVQVAAVHR